MLAQVGTYSEDGASICVDCAPGKYSNKSGASSSAACVMCGVGKYSPEKGAFSEASCTKCDVGKYSVTTGATSDSICTDCPPGTASFAGASKSSECFDECPAGFAGDILSCTACSAGSYKAIVGNSACLTCPDKSNSSEGKAVCDCDPGFTIVIGILFLN